MDIGSIEKVQAMATKISRSMRNLRSRYEARLRKWGITRLEDGRAREDLVQMYCNRLFISACFFDACTSYTSEVHE